MFVTSCTAFAITGSTCDFYSASAYTLDKAEISVTNEKEFYARNEMEKYGTVFLSILVFHLRTAGVNFINKLIINFYASRSQKHKKDSQVKQLFALLGSAGVRAAHKLVDKIDHRSQKYQ